jgi:hypothetical protein
MHGPVDIIIRFVNIADSTFSDIYHSRKQPSRNIIAAKLRLAETRNSVVPVATAGFAGDGEHFLN